MRGEKEAKIYKDYFSTPTIVSILNFQAKRMKKISQIHKRIYVHCDIFLIPKKMDRSSLMPSLNLFFLIILADSTLFFPFIILIAIHNYMSVCVCLMSVCPTRQ